MVCQGSLVEEQGYNASWYTLDLPCGIGFNFTQWQ
jgi:hypothetical protein